MEGRRQRNGTIDHCEGRTLQVWNETRHTKGCEARYVRDVPLIRARPKATPTDPNQRRMAHPTFGPCDQVIA